MLIMKGGKGILSDITCPFMHPPAMMLGSEGLNLNEKISSGASSSA